MQNTQELVTQKPVKRAEHRYLEQLRTILAENSPQTANMLAQFCDTSRSTLIECLERLVEVQIVQKYHPSTRQRGRPLTLYVLIPPAIRLLGKVIPYLLFVFYFYSLILRNQKESPHIRLKRNGKKGKLFPPLFLGGREGGRTAACVSKNVTQHVS